MIQITRPTLFGRLAISISLIASLANPAGASDLPVKAPRQDPHSAFSWTGCYLGIEGGEGWGSSQHHAATSTVPANVGLPITNQFDVTGALFGGTLGCNYQMTNVVVGLENDISWTNQSGHSPDIPPFGAGTVSTTNAKWMDTLRGRVGLAWDRLLVYGTAGAAFADVGVNVCVAAGICVADSQTRTGWAAGFGSEWAAWTVPGGTLTVKIEYLHVNFGTGLFISPPVTIAGNLFDSRNVKLSDDIVRGGLNWKFNW